MKHVEVPSYPVSIFIAGDYEAAHAICSRHCDDVGLCVTVTRTSYVYTGGAVGGVIVGLINYPRFPAAPETLLSRAMALAGDLLHGLRQESFTIQAPDKTIWISFREEDQ